MILSKGLVRHFSSSLQCSKSGYLTVVSAGSGELTWRALRELHPLGIGILAERLEHLGDDAAGVEAGLSIHGVG